jgi:hypothetical protein
MARPLELHVYPGFSRMNDFAMRKTDVSTCYAVFSIFEALKILKAIWRKRASSAFLISLGNLARYALLYKWLKPKYCSTSAPRGCTRDEERFLEVGLQEQASNHLKLQW